jgi:hypothetical protein
MQKHGQGHTRAQSSSKMQTRTQHSAHGARERACASVKKQPKRTGSMLRNRLPDTL